MILSAALPALHGPAAVSAYALPPDLLAKAKALELARTTLYFAGTAWTLFALALLVRARLGERIANLAERATGSREWLEQFSYCFIAPRFSRRGFSLSKSHRDIRLPLYTYRKTALAGLIAAPLWLLLLSAIDLPLAILSHHVSRVFHLSVQGWGAWSLDWLESTLLTVLVGTLVLSGLYALLRRSLCWAWLGFWLATLPCIVLGVFVTPLLIDPLFNHFTPLAARDPALVAQLERVVARGGLAIAPARIFVMDASRRSTGMNAYVTGFGASKRIVIWDTTLPSSTPGATTTPVGSTSTIDATIPGPMTTDELLAIYGHEQGHYVLGHIWKGILYSAALLLVFYWLALQLVQILIRRHGHAWHIAENPADWSSLGLVLLVATLLGFLADPPANAFSRWEEHQADVYGQEVVHGLVADPQAVEVRDFNRMGRVWLEDPSPNPFVVWWTYSHPPTADRARFAAGYDPWKPGGRPHYFSH